MAERLFGTDGIRGPAGSKLSAKLAFEVGQALGYMFKNKGKHPLVIGKDPRRSGYMIEYAIAAGATSTGMNVVLTGPIPTPGLAMLVVSIRASVGVMVSASHNSSKDNGIKLFGPKGHKLSDEQECQLEALVGRLPFEAFVTGEDIGQIERIEDERGRYVEHVKRVVPAEIRFDDTKVVVDCANGAMYKVAPKAFRELGATVIPIGVNPDGDNINERCGSQYPEHLVRAVEKHAAHVGIAFDGDGDRVIIVDEKGAVANGDQIVALIAKYWTSKGRSLEQGVVGTVMTNGGLEEFLRPMGIPLYRASVGDRFVLEQMQEHGAILGGEQSGHIIMSDYATTGDGLATALLVLCVAKESALPFSEVMHCFKPWPQKLANVPVPKSVLEHVAVRQAKQDAEAMLGSAGRLVLRASGTEPLVRVMVEGTDDALVTRAVDRVREALEQAHTTSTPSK